MINCTFENGRQAKLRHVCIDALVLKANQILLVKRADGLLEGGKWGLIGGYAERDETLVQAAMREVLEETGYQTSNVTLLRVLDDPQRPHEDRQNIAFVYYCTAGEKTGKPDNESSEIRWFDLNELPPETDFAFDHYQDIQAYLRIKSG